MQHLYYNASSIVLTSVRNRLNVKRLKFSISDMREVSTLAFAGATEQLGLNGVSQNIVAQ